MSPEHGDSFLKKWIRRKIFQTPVGDTGRRSEGSTIGEKSANQQAADTLGIMEDREQARQREERLEGDEGDRGGDDRGGDDDN